MKEVRDKLACTVAVDFDGVIHNWAGAYEPPNDPPIPGAIEALKKLVDDGRRVIIFTARCSCLDQDSRTISNQTIEIKHWLSRNGAEKGTHYHDVVGCKPVAAVYVDDRAIRFSDWDSALGQIKQLL